MDGKCTDEETIHDITDLHKAGPSNKEICAQKDLKLHTVHEFIQKFKADGSKDLILLQKPNGRP